METKKKASESQLRAPETWGLQPQAFLARLEEKPVTVALVNGMKYAGRLVGVGKYDLLVRQSSGLVLLIPKHAVIYLAPGAGSQSEEA